MQRYEPDFRCFRMYEDPTGDFVLYADAQAALDAKNQELEEYNTKLRVAVTKCDELTIKLRCLTEKDARIRELEAILAIKDDTISVLRERVKQRLDDVLRECVWAMQALKTERAVAWADIHDTTLDDEVVQDQVADDSACQRATAFLARPDVQARMKGAT